MDNVAFAPEIWKSRFLRICPECRTPIDKGEHYAKLRGVYDGQITGGVMCLSCNDFQTRYLQSMQDTGVETVEYSFGDIINEAAEYLDLRIRLPPTLTLAQKRGVLMSIFDFHDIAMKYARKERKTYYTTQKQRYRHAYASLRMIRGMSGWGFEDLTFRAHAYSLELEVRDDKPRHREASERMIRGMSEWGGLSENDDWL